MVREGVIISRRETRKDFGESQQVTALTIPRQKNRELLLKRRGKEKGGQGEAEGSFVHQGLAL